jgi:hypothetical protein
LDAPTQPPGSGKESGVEVPGWLAGYVFWIADGEIVRRRIFRERDETLEAASLPD